MLHFVISVYLFPNAETVARLRYLHSFWQDKSMQITLIDLQINVRSYLLSYLSMKDYCMVLEWRGKWKLCVGWKKIEFARTEGNIGGICGHSVHDVQYIRGSNTTEIGWYMCHISFNTSDIVIFAISMAKDGIQIYSTRYHGLWNKP